MNVRNDIQYPILTQSGHGNCHFIKRSVALGTSWDEELWLDNVRFAWPEDQVYFYKLFLRGYKIFYSNAVSIQNLNAKTTFKSNQVTKKKEISIAEARNPIIFWHRFLYLPEKKIYKKEWKLICILYRMIAESVVVVVRNLLFPKRWKVIRAHFHGYFLAFNFLSSVSYKSLPLISNNHLV